ncbi:AAA family ATPase [Enterococcus sp. AZ126]|uniref:AAA family ATPase n=1 Tax=Enterococcus sp. AZ126 TaxID=2774635 RepID=UPI003F2635DD
MQLRELKIKNFGCIGENELIIKIDTIVVLIGSNNVGKTTVLEAFSNRFISSI